MENNEILDNDYISNVGLSTTGIIRGYLETAAKWGRFLGIVGFVFTGFAVLSVLGIGTMMGTMEQGFGSAFPIGTTGMIIIYLLLICLYFFPALYMYQFSVSTLRSLRTEEQIEFEKAFHNLKRLFQFFGIFTAIFLAFYVLFILVAILGGI